MKKMPVMFIGHGSPMNIIEDNSYTKRLKKIASNYSVPKAILVVSAHWETNGTWLTGMKNPKTIYDFRGFPKELYEITYPAPGNPEIANQIQAKIADFHIKIDNNDWGLDHASWAVLVHLYPEANIPVVQMSLDMTKSMDYHFELGKRLRFLREQGVLILGSGNIVHSLPAVDWERDAKPHDWCVEFDEWVKDKLIQRDFNPLINDVLKSKIGRLSIPTLEHYQPLLYVLGASDKDDQLKFEFEGYQNASMSMRSLSYS